MDRFIDRNFPNINVSDVKETCSKGTVVNTRKCSHKWPKYPCYNKKMRICESTKGEQYIDPIDDILYAVAESYISLNNLVEKIFNYIPPANHNEKEEKIIRFIRDYGSTISPITNPQVNSLDYARYIDDDTIDSIIDKAKPKLLSAYDFRQNGGNKFNTIVDPKTNKKVYIFSKSGRDILKKYLLH